MHISSPASPSSHNPIGVWPCWAAPHGTPYLTAFVTSSEITISAAPPAPE
jgi:hypothetical protein